MQFLQTNLKAKPGSISQDKQDTRVTRIICQWHDLIVFEILSDLIQKVLKTQVMKKTLHCGNQRLISYLAVTYLFVSHLEKYVPQIVWIPKVWSEQLLKVEPCMDCDFGTRTHSLFHHAHNAQIRNPIKLMLRNLISLFCNHLVHVYKQ